MQAPSHIQPVAVPQQPVIVAITTTPPPHPIHSSKGKTYEAYQARASLRLGALQIIIGIFCIVFNVAAIAVGAAISPVSHGIWGGLFFILAGSFGVSAGKFRTTCPIVAFMVLSIIAALLTICMLTSSSAEEPEDNYIYCDFSDCWCGDSDSDRESRVVMKAVLTALAIQEAIIAIGLSAICCGAVCCQVKTAELVSSGQRMQCINQPGHQQIMIINLGQAGVISGLPGVIGGQPGVATAPQKYAAYPSQTPACTAPQPGPGDTIRPDRPSPSGPFPMALPQGVTHPAYTAGSPPWHGLRAPAPQA